MPVLLTETDIAFCWPYPTVAPVKLCVPVLSSVMPNEGKATTVKLTLKLRVVTLAPLTETVAVYVPAASPVCGLTVKVLLPFATMLLSDVVDNIKAVGFVPDSATVRAPVG